MKKEVCWSEIRSDYLFNLFNLCLECRTHTKTPALFSKLDLRNLVFQRTFCIMHMSAHVEKRTKKNKIPNEQPAFGCQLAFGSHSQLLTTKIFLHFSLFFCMSLTWAFRTHDGKGTFFIIFQCFWSFLTMQMHVLKIHNTIHFSLVLFLF